MADIARDNLKQRLHEYFRYYSCSRFVNGYPRETMTGKIAKYDTGGTHVAGSHVPIGVEMLGVDRINLILETGQALVALRTKSRFDYALMCMRYGLHLRINKVSELLKSNAKTIERHQKESLDFMLNVMQLKID